MIDWKSEELTFGDVLGPTAQMAEKGDVEERDAYLEQYAIYLQGRNPEWTEAEVRRTIDNNIGYWSGYYDAETAVKIKGFFEVKHPIFDHG